MYQILSVPCVGDVSPLQFNLFVAALAGAFFSSGWWIMISLLADTAIGTEEFLPGLFGSAALVVVNAIPTGLFQEPNLYARDTCCGRLAIRTCLLIGFMIAFGALIAACYLLFNDYILDEEETSKWPGYGVFLQNLFIFVATVLLRCRKPQELL